MRLEKLRIKNYRCFEDIEIDFDKRLTVLIASNGGGKTTILDAARVALWPFIKGFDLGSQTGKSATIQLDDVRLSKLKNANMEPITPSEIEAIGSWHTDSLHQWTQQRISMKRGTNTLGDNTCKKFTNFGKSLQAEVRTDSDIALPLITYLGTSRLWFEGRFTSTAAQTNLDKSEYSRTSGYLNCLSYSSSFKTFTAWYSWIYKSYRQEQIVAIEKRQDLSATGARFNDIIQAIKKSIDSLIEPATGWCNIEYSESHNQQLVMHHPEQGTLPVELLSDGLRNTIAMVADIAYRACKLNPQFGSDAPLKTSGIALIDEVDMFLHPYWQQMIVGALCNAFPAMQFVVTTHSPQVLSTVRRENIRVLGRSSEGKLTASSPLAMTYGEPSNNVLLGVMQVDPQPPVDEKSKLLQLTELVDKGRYDESFTKKLMSELTLALGPQHPQLLRLQRSIKRQEVLKK